MSPSRVALSTSRPLYAAADQPARLSLEIDGISHQGGVIPILSQDILRMPFCVLARFARRDGAALPKILVVCPLSGHFSILLRDLVIGLLPTFDVFITDWINARHVPVRHGSFNLEANNSYVATMMEYLGPDLNVIALCQAAIPALAATAYLAAKSTRAGPRTLVLIAAPVDPDANPTPVDRLIRSRSLDWYKRNVISEVPAAYAGRRRAVYSGSIQLLGLWSYLARRVWEGGEIRDKVLHDDGCDPLRFPFLDLYSTLMDLPAELLLDTVRHIFHERSIWNNALMVRVRHVDFSAIRSTALMTIEGEVDDVAAPGQTRRAHDLCPSIPRTARRHLLVPGCGHFSLFHGDIWRTRVLPEIRAFCKGHGAKVRNRSSGNRSA